MGIPEEETMNLPNYQSKHKLYKKELLRLKKKVLQFEEENINLRTEVKNLSRINNMLREEISEADTGNVVNLKQVRQIYLQFFSLSGHCDFQGFQGKNNSNRR